MTVKLRRTAAGALLSAACLLVPVVAQAQGSSCPAGTIDTLEWMTMAPRLRAKSHMEGSANPLYTQATDGKFWWMKGKKGYPADVNLYDDDYVYLWITEYDWNDANTFKKFTYNTNVPLAPRCAKPGYPGSTIAVKNTSYMLYTDCTHYTLHDLRTAVNEVWGPYELSLGGDLPGKLTTYALSYRYNCDANFDHCGDKEEFYVAQPYGLVQWVHLQLIDGVYKEQKRTVFNRVERGSTQPYFRCF